jgi:hypothetical protein
MLQFQPFIYRQIEIMRPVNVQNGATVAIVRDANLFQLRRLSKTMPMTILCQRFGILWIG